MLNLQKTKTILNLSNKHKDNHMNMLHALSMCIQRSLCFLELEVKFHFHPLYFITPINYSKSATGILWMFHVANNFY